MKWLIRSSVNPEKISLTIKGVIGVIVFLAANWGINISFNIDTLSYDIANVVSQLSVLISTIVTIYGLVRKIYFTLK
jgi:hypothetical protein